jgi:drug/metabolite transporter (DMT)-like permease
MLDPAPNRPTAPAPAAPAQTIIGSAAHASVMLVIVTVLWGLSFPLMKNWLNAAQDCPGGTVVASTTLIAMRLLLALILLACFRPRLFTTATRREHLYGIAIGLFFAAGFIIQVLGLEWASPALSAFLTSLSSACVPILGWLAWRMYVPRLTWIGLTLGLIGAAVLSKIDQDPLASFGLGEGLTLLSAVIFGVEILLLDRLGRRVQSAHLTVGLMGTAAVIASLLAVVGSLRSDGLEAWLSWTRRMLQDPLIVRDVALLTVFSTVLAFFWMNVYQPRVSASRAALIYLLEPVFAALFSVMGGHDALTLRLLAGGAIILLGNLLVELPQLLRGAPQREHTG